MSQKKKQLCKFGGRRNEKKTIVKNGLQQQQL